MATSIWTRVWRALGGGGDGEEWDPLTQELLPMHGSDGETVVYRSPPTPPPPVDPEVVEREFVRETHDMVCETQLRDPSLGFYPMDLHCDMTYRATPGNGVVWWMGADHPLAVMLASNACEALASFDGQLGSMVVYSDAVVKECRDTVVKLCRKHGLAVREEPQQQQPVAKEEPQAEQPKRVVAVEQPTPPDPSPVVAAVHVAPSITVAPRAQRTAGVKKKE